MQHPGVLLFRYLMFVFLLSLSHKLFITFQVFVELHVSAACSHHQVRCVYVVTALMLKTKCFFNSLVQNYMECFLK
jgi:hypothetical protein